ncbi:hypothetical protein VTO42DRAFT_2094 [Malbranchea cinnamomea]
MSQSAGLVDRSGGSESQQPSSSQLDPSLRHFSDPSFDPADYLNGILPPLSVSLPTYQHNGEGRASKSLADLSAQTQSLISQLSAQNARLVNTLTQLTDEIVRGGGRLAYEVEVLRGETIGLSDAITETLQEDIRTFIPEGLPEPQETPVQDTEKEGQDLDDAKQNTNKVDDTDSSNTDPEFIRQLRTLSLVRARLDDVVRVFGEAMEWPIPPSEVSISSSFISVSAPEHAISDQDLEDKGREAIRKLRAEVTELLESEESPEAGVAAASKRVESLRALAGVWKGTAEEKARLKIVDSLSRIVEDRRRALEREKEAKEQRRALSSPSKKDGSSSEHPREDKQESSGGGGLFRNLQRLRDEIYLE